MMRLKMVFAALVIASLNLAFGQSAFAQNDHAAEQVRSKKPTEIYDHHVHVLSPELFAHWKSLGMPFSREESAYTDPLSFLEAHKLSGAFLVSMAHLYTTDDFAGIEGVAGNEQQWVEKENDFIAANVAVAPEKFVGFYSVNPLAEYAMEEMNRCRENDQLTGLKLHLPACDVQLTDPEDLSRVKEVFDWAVLYDVPLLVHLFTADEDDPRELARIFWKELIQPRSSIEITLAHIGAAGGFNEVSEAVLNGYLDLRAAEKTFENARIRFDLSGAILPDDRFGITATSDEACLKLSKLIEQIGTNHFLFASDYPVFSFQEAFEVLQNKLTAREGQFDAILKKPSRWFSIKREIAKISLPEIRLELLKRQAEDQAARRSLSSGQFKRVQPKVIALVNRIDQDNREWLKKQVDEHGWLSASKVGTDGASAAWLLVQHADRDPKFQRQCLDLMTPLGDDEVIKSNVALLTDRVLLAEGKKQRYGTQFNLINGELKMRDCEDVETLDERRASVGLSPIAEYEALLQSAYKGAISGAKKKDK